MNYKTVSNRAFVLATIFIIYQCHAQPSGYAITQQGADWRVLSKTTIEHGTNRIHKYTELATGLNYTNSYGQLVESKEIISILPQGGAAATQGRHKAYFPGDIYRGQIEVVTPDGLHLKSRPLVLSYDDGTNTVLLAVLTNSIGVLAASNQVIYPDAFSGLKADVRYTYKKGGFEQDIVLQEQPPSPEAFGMSSQSTRLEVLTEFFNPPTPKQTRANANAKTKAGRQAALPDTTLAFGKMKMMQGKAFAIDSGSGGNSAQTRQSRLTSAATRKVSVSKSWVSVKGRTFLIEEVPVPGIAPQLQQLPAAASATVSSAQPRPSTFGPRHFELPPSRPVQDNSVQLAKTDIHYNSGLVLDYDEIDSDQTDFTFESGQTYFVSGYFNINGTATFEGGTVLKFSEDGSGGLYLNGDIVCPTTPDEPAILTSVNDDSKGDVISDVSTGTPAVGWGDYINQWGSSPLKNFRFYYAGCAVMQLDPEIWNCEFHDCEAGVDAMDFSIAMYNCLFSHCTFFFMPDSFSAITVRGQNITVDHCVYYWNVYCSNQDGSLNWDKIFYWGSTLLFTNSIFSDDTLGYGTYNGYLLNTYNGIEGYYTTGFFNGGSHNAFFDNVVGSDDSLSLNSSPYQAAANDPYYLTQGSPCHNAGTTNIDPDLLAELRTMTTYAPQDGGFPDTNAPDLGYHYPINEDSDYDGLPDWWEWKYFHSYACSGTDLDSSGANTLAYDYANGLDPNKISFSLQFTNNYLNTNVATGRITVSGGVPSYYAVLVNDTDFTNANWQPYTSSNIVVTLGSTDGVYNVFVGLRGLATNSWATWQLAQLTLNTTVPAFTITNPASSTVSVPLIQLQGLVNESLSSLTFDVSNAAGIFTNQSGNFNPVFYDTDRREFTTNSFQCYDVALTNGLNTITLHATDLTGGTATTNVNYTLDYSSNTNPPALTLLWPTNGTCIGGSNFTLRAQVDDPTASVTVSLVDTNDETNIVSALVERSGHIWSGGLPLGGGTNIVTIMATNAAGHASITNFNVVAKDIGLTINPLTNAQMNHASVTVTGSVGDPGDNVTVNGVAAYATDDVGGWQADGVPVNADGTATLDVEVTDSDSNPVASQISNQSQPATVQLTSSSSFTYSHYIGVTGIWQGIFFFDEETVRWSDSAGGDDLRDGITTSEYGTSSLYTETSLAPGPGGYGPWANLSVAAAGFEKFAQSKVEIVPSGQAQVGTTTSYLVHVSALGYSDLRDAFRGELGDVPLEPETLTVNEQSLVSSTIINDDGTIDGLTLISATSGARAPLTVTAQTANYTFNVQVNEINLQLAVDNNRDGDITFDTPNQVNPDKSSESNPYRFWVNDDEDNYDGSGVSEDVVPVVARNCDDFIINSPRDLEDLSRLHLTVEGIADELANGTFLLGLKWKNVRSGAPSINIFQAVEANGGTLYLTDESVAGQQSPVITPCTTVLNNHNDYHQVDTSGTFLIKPSFWNGFAGGKKYFLFEGCSVGKGQLVITINKPDGTELAEAGSVWLDIKDIKSMYQRVKATPYEPNGIPAPFDETTTFDETTASTEMPNDGFTFSAPPDETQTALVFVHGSNIAYDSAVENGETMFKRLWWQGYKGRFVLFYWNTLIGPWEGTIPAHYNYNEYRAFKYGLALKNYVANGLPSGYTKNVVGHSMGNMVVASALYPRGITPGMTANNVIFMQAAVPASCLDFGVATLPELANLEDPQTTPDAFDFQMGYRKLVPDNVNATLYNIYNANDYALGWWAFNQHYFKPENLATPIPRADLYYNWNLGVGGSLYEIGSGNLIRDVTDPQESMSFIARSRTAALGTMVTSGSINTANNFDVGENSPTGLGKERPDHSGEFTRPIQQLNQFYSYIYDIITKP